MLISKEDLCQLIPHAGDMCLLDTVVNWNQTAILCSTNSHLDPDNPLRRKGQLAGIHLLEYGAQAAAVHGGLLGRRKGKPIAHGYLAALRDVTLRRDSIDDIKTTLRIRAQQISALDGNCIYEFTVSAEDLPLVSARATIIAEEAELE